MAQVLSIIESAYRATVEEQDDTAVWISRALKGAGCDIHVLLRGSAVNYAVKGQRSPPMTIGSWSQVHPPDPAGQIAGAIASGVHVHAVQDDLAARGVEPGDLVQGVQLVDRAGVAELVSRYEQVWHW